MTNDASTLEYVAGCMEYEGFDYCFRFYSHFEEVEDPEFHRLRAEYTAAANALEEYVQAQVYSEDDDHDAYYDEEDNEEEDEE